MWVEALLKQFEHDTFDHGTRNRILRKEAWANCLHRGSKGYYHATFMKPQCQVVSIDDETEPKGAGDTGDPTKEALCLYVRFPVAISPFSHTTLYEQNR